MTGPLAELPVRRRLIAAVLLAAVALLLSVAGAGGSSPAIPGTRAEILSAEAGIAAAVDTLLAREGVGPGDIRSWRATAAGKPTGRIEQRVTVGRGFLSLNFNHALGLMVAPFGARVVGTEKTREQVVTLHIIRGRTTIRSISFFTDAGR